MRPRTALKCAVLTALAGGCLGWGILPSFAEDRPVPVSDPIENLGARSPLKKWRELRKEFDTQQEIELSTELSRETLAPRAVKKLEKYEQRVDRRADRTEPEPLTGGDLAAPLTSHPPLVRTARTPGLPPVGGSSPVSMTPEEPPTLLPPSEAQGIETAEMGTWRPTVRSHSGVDAIRAQAARNKATAAGLPDIDPSGSARLFPVESHDVWVSPDVRAREAVAPAALPPAALPPTTPGPQVTPALTPLPMTPVPQPRVQPRGTESAAPTDVGVEVQPADLSAQLEFRSSMAEDSALETIPASVMATLEAPALPAPRAENRPNPASWMENAATAADLPPISGIQPFADYVPETSDQNAPSRVRPNQDEASLPVPPRASLGETPYQGREFDPYGMAWTASNIHYHPLYFEDVALERYGQSHGPIVQPFVSLSKFGAQLLGLPYQATLHPICEDVYPLGYYRPGEPAPELIEQVPLSAEAAAVTGGVYTGLFFLVP